MPCSSYIIAYDIAHPRRLARVARLLERHALRIQKSVFLYAGSKDSLERLMAGLRLVINQRDDVVEAWPLKPGRRQPAHSCGMPHRLAPSSLIVVGGRHIAIEGSKMS